MIQLIAAEVVGYLLVKWLIDVWEEAVEEHKLSKG